MRIQQASIISCFFLKKVSFNWYLCHTALHSHRDLIFTKNHPDVFFRILEASCLAVSEQRTRPEQHQLLPTAPSENENLYQGEELFSFHFCLLSRYENFFLLELILKRQNLLLYINTGVNFSFCSS